MHGSARASIENAFGMLKLKFQSLQNLPVQINSEADMDRAASWVMACVVLHNLVRRDAVEEIVEAEIHQLPVVNFWGDRLAPLNEGQPAEAVEEVGSEVLPDLGDLDHRVNRAIGKAKRDM
ncbi:hypothetical protein BGZ97_006564 [Linnemannia gamsii]|uniref:DDE Tnp4 domain-containing protein n=1 Tax=Linnemannia gamsii TaxID=64522 RepID=A0A9P6QT65_9FUNG|nr:hypothetical protein BGZ97_006564 [Linnemannia gamsii]